MSLVLTIADTNERLMRTSRRSFDSPRRAHQLWKIGATLLLFLVLAPLLLVGTGAQSAQAASLGPYNLKNKVTGKCVDIPGYGNGKINGPVQQYTCNYTTSDNQRFWMIERGTHTTSSGNTYKQYQIKNIKDGLCLDLPGYGSNPNGTLVSEYTCAGSTDNQYFYKVPRAVGGSWLVNTKSAKCLDVAGTAAGNDARLTLYTCSDTNDHRWTLVS